MSFSLSAAVTWCELSEVCCAIFGQKEDVRPCRSDFASPFYLMHLTHDVILLFSLWHTQHYLWNPKMTTNLFLDHICVDGPAALECNLNNICILCCILYKTLALCPSFWAFNHWASGGCGYLLFEATHKKKEGEKRAEQSQDVGGEKKKNLPPNTQCVPQKTGDHEFKKSCIM